MIKYAYIKVGVPPANNATARAAFNSSVKFNVGGHLYSLNEWESGILRCNAKIPVLGSLPFTRKDPRYQYILESRDPRVHFALNRTCRNAPPITLFSAENLDEELDIAAAVFCDDNLNVTFDKTNSEIHLSEIFRWYRSDFVNSEKDLPDLIFSYMKGVKKQMLKRLLDDGSSVAVNYVAFDWSCSTHVNALVFDPNNLKAEQTRGFRLLGKR
jgi:Protein of unknown function, DUF547